MNQIKHVSIIGSCVCRDALRLHDDMGFVIDRFVQDIHPISAGANSNIGIPYQHVVDTILTQYEMPNFYRRTFALEFTGSVFDYLSEVTSDYLIFDMACCRFDCYQSPIYNGKVGEIRTKYIRYSYDIALKHFCKNNNFPLFSEEITDENSIKKLMDQYVPKYLEKIAKLYPQKDSKSSIIFVETIPVDFCLCKNGRIRECITGRKKIDSKWIDSWKERVNYGNRLAMQYLDGCHLIEFPDYILVDENHKWGAYRFHYIYEYYEYVFKSINIIMQNLPIEEEKEILKAFKEECSKKCYDKYYRNAWDTFHSLEEIKSVNRRLMRYIDFFRDMLMDNRKLSNALNNVRKVGIHNCAFYGLNQISIFFIKFFEKEDIIVDYVIENGKNQYYDGHIIQLQRDTTNYPKTDLIIIGDIWNIPAIEAKLKKITTIPFSNVLSLVEDTLHISNKENL